MPFLWHQQFNELEQFSESFESGTFHSIKIPTNKRLGKIAEDLFSIGLKASKRYGSIVENLQIIENKHTLGELDMLLFDSLTKTHFHIELVTKFYLYNPQFEADDIKAWIGPNRNDSLYDKVKKLKEKQLPLLHHPFTKHVLNNYDLAVARIKQRVFFKANLFVPVDFESKLTVFNNKCIVGYYMTFKAFVEKYNVATSFHCPKKLDWLCEPSLFFEWYDLERTTETIKKFMQAEQSLMVWVNTGNDFKKVIVVPYKEF